MGLFSSLARVFKPRMSGREIQGSPEAVQGLRQMVLSTDPTSLGIERSESNKVWALLTETGYPDAVVTLVAIADGTVSLYFSNGGGIIGAGNHERVRNASDALLAAAPAFLASAQPTAEYPQPSDGNTRFYFLTFDGVFTVEAREDDLGNSRLPISPLFHKAHEVITEIRLTEKGGNKRQSSSPSIAEQLIAHAATGNESALGMMLDSGLDPNSSDKTGLTPLMAASYEGKSQILHVLLERGCSIEAKDSDGQTALMFACNAGRADCAAILLEKGADLNALDKTNSTPIMFAAQHGHNEVLRLLLSRGADPNATGKHGLSAIGFAKQNKLPETERILRGEA